MTPRRSRAAFLCRASVIAALYAVLTVITAGVSSGPLQIRISEALCVLAVFTPAAVPGLTVGCIAANLLTGCALWDVVFGSLATLAGALGVRLLRRLPYLAPAPYTAANVVGVSCIFRFVYGMRGPEWLAALGSLAVSETLAAWGLGIVLYLLLRKSAGELF